MRELFFEVLDKNKKALSLYEIEQQFDNVERGLLGLPITKLFD